MFKLISTVGATILRELRRFLVAINPGNVAETAELERLLAASWSGFDGGNEHGMEGYKLHGRMEKVFWEPPNLRFLIERHGGAAHGSVRTELQEWILDLNRLTARGSQVGYRQVSPTAPQINIKAIADEISRAIIKGEQDDRVERLSEDLIKVNAAKAFPVGSGPKQTVEGRRKALVKYVGTQLKNLGWTKQPGNRFFRNSGHSSSSAE